MRISRLVCQWSRSQVRFKASTLAQPIEFPYLTSSLDSFMSGNLCNESEEAKAGVVVSKPHATEWYVDRPGQKMGP